MTKALKNSMKKWVMTSMMTTNKDKIMKRNNLMKMKKIQKIIIQIGKNLRQ